MTSNLLNPKGCGFATRKIGKLKINYCTTYYDDLVFYEQWEDDVQLGLILGQMCLLCWKSSQLAFNLSLHSKIRLTLNVHASTNWHLFDERILRLNCATSLMWLNNTLCHPVIYCLHPLCTQKYAFYSSEKFPFILYFKNRDYIMVVRSVTRLSRYPQKCLGHDN